MKSLFFFPAYRIYGTTVDRSLDSFFIGTLWVLYTGSSVTIYLKDFWSDTHTYHMALACIFIYNGFFHTDTFIAFNLCDYNLLCYFQDGDVFGRSGFYPQHAASAGVGHMVYAAKAFPAVKVMFVGLAIIGFAGLVVDRIFMSWLESKTIERWGMASRR